MNEKKTLRQKLLEVSKAIDYLQKDKKNVGQNYSYLSEAKIKEKFKKEFEKQGILFNYSTKEITHYEISPTHKGIRQFCTIAKGEYYFLNVDNDDHLYGEWAGSGTDTGDKGLYKAITGGIKYVLNTDFLIPTGDDPENDDGHPVNTNGNKSKVATFGKYEGVTWEEIAHKDMNYFNYMIKNAKSEWAKEQMKEIKREILGGEKVEEITDKEQEKIVEDLKETSKENVRKFDEEKPMDLVEAIKATAKQIGLDEQGLKNVAIKVIKIKEWETISTTKDKEELLAELERMQKVMVKK